MELIYRRLMELIYSIKVAAAIAGLAKLLTNRIEKVAVRVDN